VCQCGFTGSDCSEGDGICRVDILEMTLDGDIVDYPPESEERDTFFVELIEHVASAAGNIRTQRVVIESLSAGSVVVRFRIDEGTEDDDVPSAVATAQLNAADVTSFAFSGNLGVPTDSVIMTVQLAHSNVWSVPSPEPEPEPEYTDFEMVVYGLLLLVLLGLLLFLGTNLVTSSKYNLRQNATHADRYAGGQAPAVVRDPASASRDNAPAPAPYVPEPERAEPVPAPAPAEPVISHTVTFEIEGSRGREPRREVVDIDEAPRMTVEDLKRCLVDHGLASAQCELSYRGVPLRVDSFTIGEYGITDGAEILVREPPLRTASPPAHSSNSMGASMSAPGLPRTQSPAPLRDSASVRPVSPPPRQLSTSLDVNRQVSTSSNRWQQAHQSVGLRTASGQASAALHALRAAKQAHGSDAWGTMSKDEQQRAILEYSRRYQQQSLVGRSMTMASARHAHQQNQGRTQATAAAIAGDAPQQRVVTPPRSGTGPHLRATFQAIQAAQSMSQQQQQQQQQQQRRQQQPQQPVMSVSSAAPSTYGGYGGWQPPPPSPTVSMVNTIRGSSPVRTSTANSRARPTSMYPTQP
jgi:hypothetical protein